MYPVPVGMLYSFVQNGNSDSVCAHGHAYLGRGQRRRNQTVFSNEWMSAGIHYKNMDLSYKNINHIKRLRYNSMIYNNVWLDVPENNYRSWGIANILYEEATHLCVLLFNNIIFVTEQISFMETFSGVLTILSKMLWDEEKWCTKFLNFSCSIALEK